MNALRRDSVADGQVERRLRTPFRRRATGALALLQVRLRIPAALLLAAVVVGQWDVIRNYWDRLTRPIAAESLASRAVSADTEYFCPMDAGVVSDWPAKCGACNMALVRRKRGEAVMLPDGVIARMQLSPYRVQLAGVRTAPASFLPLMRELESSGVVVRGQSSATVAVELPARQAPWVAAGVVAEVMCADLPGYGALPGRVQTLERDTAGGWEYLRATIAIDKPPAELRAGMVAVVRLKIAMAALDPFRSQTAGTGRPSSQPPGQVLAIPQSAVVDTGVRKVVFVESMPGMFDGIEVVLGPRCGDYYPVLQGLEAGQQIAIAGAFLLDAETRLNPSLASAYFGAGRGQRAAAPEARPSQARAPEPKVDRIAAALESLPAGDRALAVRQKICPVTRKPLGSMGTPARAVALGRVVLLCCDGCKDALEADPAKHLAKLSGPESP
jgi:hypothetical protein